VNALVFGSYTWLIQFQANRNNGANSVELPPLSHVFIAGMGAGVITR
jgi:hypothetical protein